jgi:hypothetical protein
MEWVANKLVQGLITCMQAMEEKLPSLDPLATNYLREKTQRRRKHVAGPLSFTCKREKEKAKRRHEEDLDKAMGRGWSHSD